MRVMAGMEERTIAEKLADPNRPTWEQYKKDNHDKLNLSGMDQQKMEEYRKELDKERDQRLARGSNHKKSHSKRKHSDDDDSEDNDLGRKRKSKKHKKSRRKSKKKYDSSESDTDSSEEERRRKKKSSKKSKKSSKRDEGKDEPEDDRYRLSNFFNATGSDSD